MLFICACVTVLNLFFTGSTASGSGLTRLDFCDSSSVSAGGTLVKSVSRVTASLKSGGSSTL